MNNVAAHRMFLGFFCYFTFSFTDYCVTKHDQIESRKKQLFTWLGILKIQPNERAMLLFEICAINFF